MVFNTVLLHLFAFIIFFSEIHLCKETKTCMSRNSFPITSLNKTLNVGKRSIPLLIFFHVYKTGGSTLRKILREYSDKCGYHLSIFIHCKDPSKVAFEYQKNLFPCKAKEGGQHGNKVENYNKVAIINDVIAGHIRFGMKGLSTSRRDTYYVTWMRNPLSMLLSSIIYEINKFDNHKTIENAINILIRKITNKSNLVSQDNQYTSYIKYYRVNSTYDLGNVSIESVFEEIKTNLDKFKLIGILENHNISVIMLRKLIDPQKSLRSYWYREAKKVYSNPTVLKFTKNDILKKIKSNASLWQEVKRTLSLEFSIYEYGLKLHNQMCINSRFNITQRCDIQNYFNRENKYDINFSSRF